MRWQALSVVVVAWLASCGGEEFSSGDTDDGAGAAGESSGSGGAAGAAGRSGGRSGGTRSGESGDGSGDAGGETGSGAESNGGENAQGGSSNDAGNASQAGNANGGKDVGAGGDPGAQGGNGGSANSGNAGSAGSSGSGQRPVFTELLMDGFIATRAHAVSADGTYIAGEGTIVGGIVYPLRWRDADGLQLGDDVTWRAAYGYGISDNGEIVVGTINTLSTTKAFVWDGAVHELLPLVSGGNYAEAVDVSGDGHVVVGSSLSAENEGVAVKWTDGSVQQLPLLDGHSSAFAKAVSYNGGVIIGTGTLAADGSYEAVGWPGQGVYSLGLPNSEGYGVAGGGLFAVGGYAEVVEMGPGYRTAFRYNPGGTDDLPPPVPHDEMHCNAYGASDDGAIVYGNCTEWVETTTVSHWFLWSEERGSVELDQILRELGVDTSVYRNLEVTDISGDGTALVGITAREGASMGFRAYIDGAFP